MRYDDARSFRRALENRLKRESLGGIPLDRLRKRAAHERLLARLTAVAPESSWALKGGMALVARLGDQARATKDADANWRRSLSELRLLLDEVVDHAVDDFFEFEIGEPRTLEAEGPDGGFRFPVTARLDGRVFERIQLDINVVTDDPRPAETIALPTLFAFAGLPMLEIPVVPVEQHLAEKLHAYCRSYGGQPSGRPRDLYDMLRVAEAALPTTIESLRDACVQTFELRKTDWPPAIKTPPVDWRDVWKAYVEDYELPWKALDEAYRALRSFWDPVCSGLNHAAWNAVRWDWERR